MIKAHEFEISKNLKKSFQDLVLTFSKKNLRDFSWRRNRNPYKILVSEVLLTKTKADQVAPIFLSFMDLYPTLNKFLNIKYLSVKSLIKSLGLIRRAANLKCISFQLKNYYNGKIPNSLSALKSLKGIGEYCANAVLCFGFGRKSPILDSNIIRIYNRVFAIKSKLKTARNDKLLWKFAEYMLPEKNFIEFNYSLLDIGGLYCLARKPKCENCPLKLVCMLYKNIK